MKKLLTSLLILSMFSGVNALTLHADSSSSILVGQAKTIEEKADVALDNINLNTDLNNVVTNLLVPLEGLYESSIVWSSSNEDFAYAEENNTMIKITRPSFGEDAVEVTLTATLTIYESKTSNITKTKDFKKFCLYKKPAAPTTAGRQVFIHASAILNKKEKICISWGIRQHKQVYR